MTLNQKIAVYGSLLSQRRAVRLLMIASPSLADWFAWEEMSARIEAKIQKLELPPHLLEDQRNREEDS